MKTQDERDGAGVLCETRITSEPLPIKARANEDESIKKYRADYKEPQGRLGILDAIHILLKDPGSIGFLLINGVQRRLPAYLLLVTVLALALYGAAMGTFTGGWQILAAMFKTVVVTLSSAVVCLPSLYIMALLGGSTQRLRVMGHLLTASLCITAVLLLGFTPIIWVFGQSTQSVAFMGLLHVLFAVVALSFGMRFILTTVAFVNGIGVNHLRLWCLIFTCVIFQMTTALRPMIGMFNGWDLAPKKNFIIHWGERL